MSTLNVLRIIGLLLICFLFFLGFGVFGISNFIANSAFTDDTASMISDTMLSALPTLLQGQNLGLPSIDLNVDDKIITIFKPVLEKNISNILKYIRGETETIGLGLDKEEIKAIITNMKIPGLPEEMTIEDMNISESAYDEMVVSINASFKDSEAELIQTLQPARDVYSYAKTAFYISLIVLIVLILITLLINFCFYKTLFWLALYFLINSGIWILLLLGLYVVYSSAISSLFAGQVQALSGVMSAVVSGFLFKILLIYIVLFVIGLVLLGLFIMWKLKIKKKGETKQ